MWEEYLAVLHLNHQHQVKVIAQYLPTLMGNMKS